MSIGATLATELTMEAATTRRVLERVPENGLTWPPHKKSMSLGQLAMHVATLPQQLSEFVGRDTLDVGAAGGGAPEATSREALLSAYATSLARATEYLEDLSDASAMSTWTLTAGQRTLFAAPRAGVIRSFLLNHWYHHRGQLIVYLRLLDVPVPSVYGPTADENPFDASL
jgi:uncharacterized damage-inducible protein DinB